MCGKFVCGWLSFLYFFSTSFTRYLGVGFCGYAEQRLTASAPACTRSRSRGCCRRRFVCSCNQPSSRQRRRSVVVSLLPVCVCVALRPASSPAPASSSPTATETATATVVLCGPVMRSAVLVVFVLAAVVVVVVALLVVVVALAEPIGRVDGSMAFRLSFGNLRVAATTPSGLGSCLLEWKVLCGWPSLAN